MVPHAAAGRAGQRKAWLLVALMCSALLPMVAPTVAADGGRAASITVTGIPGSLEVNPGEAGEYTVRVRNTGSIPSRFNSRHHRKQPRTATVSHLP